MYGLLRPSLVLGALGILCLTLLFLMVLPTHALGDSSGDAPPAGGDWNINNATALWDETRVIQGSINVNDGSLTLTNVTLYLQGHLLVEAPTDIHHSNVTLARAGGEAGVDVREVLVLDNTTLRLNLTVNPSQAEEQQRILVRGSGTLLVHNNSLISDGLNEEDDDTAAPEQQASTNYRLRFIVLSGARFEVHDSTISEVGWTNPAGGGNPDQTRGGISVETTDVVLHNATITKCWYGLYLRTGANNARIDNSTFIDIEAHGVVSYGTDGLIENTTFQELNIAFFAYYQSVRWTFQYNTITGCTNGLQLNFADNHLIQYNQFSTIGQRVFDLRADAVQNTIRHNTIDTAAYGLWSEGARQTWGDRTNRWNPHHLYFTDNQLTNVVTGIQFDAGSTSDRTRSGGHNVTFADNIFDGGVTGIVVSQGGNTRLIDDFTISGNRLINVTDIGFQFTQLSDSLISDNRIIGGSIGIKLIKSTGLRLSYNQLNAPNFTGFHLTDSSRDNELDNNTIEGSLGQGFYLKSSGPNAIHDNRVANFTGAGLWAEERVTGTVSDNVLEHGGEGFHLVGTAPTIQDNTLTNLRWGYYLLDVTLASIEDQLSEIAQGRLWQENSLTVTIQDEQNNTKRNIEVEVYDVNERLVATDASDSEGLTRTFNLTHYQLDPQGLRTDSTPHRAWAYRGTGSVQAPYSVTSPDGQLTLHIDLISPASWVIPQGDYVNTSQVQVRWQVLGDHSDVVFFHIDHRVMEPGGPYSNWTHFGTYETTTALYNVTEGNTYQIRSQAEDDFGNLEEGSSEWEFQVDMTPPSSVLTSPDVADGEKTALEVVHLEWAPANLILDIDSYTLLHRWRSLPTGQFGQWSVYGGQEDTQNDNLDFEGPGGFEYQLKVQATDRAGNRELKIDADLSFIIDHQAPEAWLEPLPIILDSDRLELTVDFQADSDLEFVTIRYLKYLEVRYEEGDAPTGTWLNLGAYDLETLRQGPIVIDQLATNSYYLFRLMAQDDVGNLDDRTSIQEFYTGNGSAAQTLLLQHLVEPAGASYTNGHVKVQALQGEDYGPALRQSTKWPLENPDMYFLDERTGRIDFGDGQNGFQPAAGQTIKVTYDGYDDLTLVDFSPPAAPTDLNSVKLSNTSIMLTWHVPTSLDVIDYRVEFSYNVQWQNMTTVAHEPISGFVSVDLENLTRTVYHFRVVAIDRVGLESSPTGEVKVDLKAPADIIPADADDDGASPPIGVIALILVVVMIVCAAAFHISSGRGRSEAKARAGPGGSLAPHGRAPAAGPRLEPVARDEGVHGDELQGLGGQDPGGQGPAAPAQDHHLHFSRPGQPPLSPSDAGPTAPGSNATEAIPGASIPSGPPPPLVAPEVAPMVPVQVLPREPETPSTSAAFQLLDGELICLACGTVQGLMVGAGVEVTCHACGTIGLSPLE